MVSFVRKTLGQNSVVLIGIIIVILTLVACAPPATPTPAPTAVPPAPTTAPATTAPPAATAPPPTAVPPTATRVPPTATAAPPPTAAAPTTFRVAIGVDMDTLDPVGQTTTTVSNVIDYVAETLVTIDKDGKVLPMLAKSWTVSKDGLEYTFKLQEGVKFHDGKPFDATAVKVNFERLLDADVRNPVRGNYTPISKIEVVDPTTVKLILSKPSAPLLAVLSMTNGAILSPASIEKSSAEYKLVTKPIGTGPYVFKEHVKGSQVAVTRNPNYWGKKPYYDNVVFRIVPEAATRESLLLAGQVDMIILPPISDIPALEKNTAVKVLLAPSNRIIFITINTTKPPFDNVKVRQALNYAVNKEEIIKSVLFGAAGALDAPMAASLIGYCKTGAYPYDPAKAKALLKEAGVTTPVKAAFISPTGRYVQDFQASQAIAGFLKDIGVEADLKTMDWPSYVATITKPQAEQTINLHFLGWAPGFLDAAQQMLQYDSTQHPPKGLATSFYKNAKVEELSTAALGESDPKKRDDLYCQASKIVWEEAPFIFLWNQRFPIVYSAKVTNVSYLPNEKFYALYAEPAR